MSRGAASSQFYHREPGPVSIDLLRRFFADGWRLTAWPDDGSRTFVYDLANGDGPPSRVSAPPAPQPPVFYASPDGREW